MTTMKIHSKTRWMAALLAAVMMVLALPFGAIGAIEAEAAAPASYTDISAGSTVTINITVSGTSRYFRFVPTVSGSYTVWSTGSSCDPTLEILDASGTKIGYSDDDGDGYNFRYTGNYVAGTTYYIWARMCGNSGTGSYTLHISAPVHTHTPGAAADCDSAQTCTSCGAVLAAALGHNFVSGTCTRCGATDGGVGRSYYNSSTGDVYLGGTYIELGIGRKGSFGTSSSSAVSGFHRTGQLGMIVDGDGWDVGAAPTTGDFFVPGTPEECYILAYKIGGTTYQYRVSDRNGNESGTWRTAPTVRNASSGSLLKAIVTGTTTHGVELEITYSFCANDKAFLTDFKVTNTGSSTITDVRFVRSFDPDQDAEKYGEYDTYSKVICNPSSAAPGSDENYAMVVAHGKRTLDSFFFIAFDNRARASRGVAFTLTNAYASGLWTDSATLPTSATASSLAISATNTNGHTREDSGIAITFALGTLSTGASTEGEYYSSLSPTVDFELCTHIPGAAADCENPQVCTSCGDVLTPALGHAPGAAADCDTAQTCTRCGEELAAALGHNFVSGTCTRCGATTVPADVWDGSVATSFGGGTGTSADPYRIYTGAQLAYLAATTNSGTTYSGKYFKLMNNIDLNDREWTPIGKGNVTNDSYTATCSFQGSFLGEYHVISNLKITTNNTTFTGLFGCLYNATVSGLGIEDADINLRQRNGSSYRTTAGILAGASYGATIRNCYTTGTLQVDSSSYIDVGCIVGDYYNSNVTNCYVVADVSTTTPSWGHTGGLFGFFDDTSAVSNCLFIGTVRATEMDYLPGALSSKSSEQGICNGFYYSGTPSDTRGTSLSTAQLAIASNFSGWDFTNVWEYRAGANHPVLRGFDDPGVPTDAWDGSVDTSWYNSTNTEFTIYTAEQLAGLAQLVNCGNTFSGKTIYLGNNIDLANREWTPIGYTSGFEFRGVFDGNRHAVYNMTITRLTNAASSVQFGLGLFGYSCNLSAVFKNFAVLDFTIDLVADCPVVAGGVAGWLSGRTENVYAEGNINLRFTSGTCDSRIGLFAGQGWDGSLNNCYAAGSLTVANHDDTFVYVGGFMGLNNGSSVSNSYVVADIATNGSSVHAGGFVGLNGTGRTGFSCVSGSFQKCFAVGSLRSDAYGGGFCGNAVSSGSITTCYYATEVNAANAAYSYGTSTSLSNLRSQSWITSNLGWDFTDVWTFDGVSEYPVLQGFDDRDPDPHTHTPGAAADCENAQVCTECGEELAPALGHTPGAEADCENAQVCTECGEELAPALGHTPGAEADCENAQVCTECGEELAPALGHTAGEWVVDAEPTCTVSGRKHRDCTACGETVTTVYLPAIGHRYTSVLTRAATCTTPGVMTYTCVNCSNSYIIYIYSEHNYEHASRTEPTCEADGADVYTCTACGDSYSIPIAGGHNYNGVIERVATATDDGLIRYTCSLCGDEYTEVIPARPDANVLLVQDRFPWSENNNARLLDAMLADGYITGWDLTTTAGFSSVSLAKYSVILIANDQSTATYRQLEALAESLASFASAGGTVIYGACDHGWAGGHISHSLPEGVTKSNYYSHHNYIVDSDHAIVLGNMTDGRSLTNQLLYGNYCSHTSFDAASLPEDANVILQDARGNATLVEYAVGNGHVILSGLTWEFYYTRSAYDYRLNTTYTRNVYDDLVVYAVSLANACAHEYGEGTVVPPTCTEQGYTVHVCIHCEAELRESYTPATGHTRGEWVTVTEPTTETEGLREKRCTVCGEPIEREVLPIIDAPTVKVEADDEVILGQEITFTVVLEDFDPIKSMSLVPVFDTDVFELVSASWASIGAFMTDIEEGTLRSVAAWETLGDKNGIVYTITLRAKALTDASEVTATVQVMDDAGIVLATVLGKTVAVIECPHENVSHTALDGEFHSTVCDLCGYGEVLVHEYDGLCDACCDVCEYERVAPHAPSADFTTDAASHWHACELCGIALNTEAHEYADPCDEVCDVCGFERVAPHAPSLGFITDGSEHWHACELCGLRMGLAAHEYTDACDPCCDVCEYERVAPHVPAADLTSDGDAHWHACELCGLALDAEAHEYDDDYDHLCNICGYDRILLGDLDHDGDADSDDAIYLLYAIMFGLEDYPLNQSGDFDGDSDLDTDDAIYLLYYTFFGAGDYPLRRVAE